MRKQHANRKIDPAIDATADDVLEALTCDFPTEGKGCGRKSPRGFVCTRHPLHTSSVHVACGLDRPEGTDVFDIWRAESDD